ncbi:hypothetical protein [Desulfonatronum sp. SC1]|uniref:hypothetical protein n=1 Tax=Desulfonatronum sp. SC1 TaxID=2109626 RepID=UPI000D3158CC|nr:hypothetical protein [Desulfonatronum sp. SC1]PTN33569.1 hypothetical protein C6366_14085 [Desulfonatronum sp. SC1]
MLRRIIPPLLSLMLLLCVSGYAEEERIRALWPSATPRQMTGDSQTLEATDKPYIIRVGTVVLAVSVFLPPAEVSGKQAAAAASFRDVALSVAFFSDKEYTVGIDSDTRHGPDAMTLGGRTEDLDLSTFTMTVTRDSYLITFQDLDTATLYRVVGNTGTGLGAVTEIDLTKTPPIEYLPPLIPTP